MFGFFKKRLFRMMIRYVDIIKLAVYAKLRPELEKQHAQETAGQLSGAVVNRLFGSAVSPAHVNLPSTLIDKLATDFLKNEKDKDLLHGIVMSLRTLMTVESDARNTEATNRISDTVQWIKTIIPLPPEAPDPKIMKHLAAMLQSRYC
jgi:hypothetical protein